MRKLIYFTIILLASLALAKTQDMTADKNLRSNASMDSHVETRALLDALTQADSLLQKRGTSLITPTPYRNLKTYFAPKPYPDFFNGWAYTAENYASAVARIEIIAPQLLEKLLPPQTSNDFTVVGNCNLDLRFAAERNGAYETTVQLRTGESVMGASVTSSRALRYANGLLALPDDAGRKIFFFMPETAEVVVSAASLAHQVFIKKMEATKTGFTLIFPVAHTANVLAQEWVMELESADGQYFVKNHISAGEARVDHNGFFAQETQVVQIRFRSASSQLEEIIFDRPFLVFFADGNGVHAAAWFDYDSFKKYE